MRHGGIGKVSGHRTCIVLSSAEIAACKSCREPGSYLTLAIRKPLCLCPQEEPLKPKCAEALLDHHWHVAPVAPSHAPPFQELWVADAPHGHVAEPDIVVGEGQVTSTSGSPASPPLPQLEAMSTWEVVPALPQGVMASSQVPHVWHPAPSPPTVPDDSPGRDFASSPRAFLPARLPPFAAPRAPPSDRGATATDKATACDYDVSVLEALRRKGARTPLGRMLRLAVAVMQVQPIAPTIPWTDSGVKEVLFAPRGWGSGPVVQILRICSLLPLGTEGRPSERILPLRHVCTKANAWPRCSKRPSRPNYRDRNSGCAWREC